MEPGQATPDPELAVVPDVPPLPVDTAPTSDARTASHVASRSANDPPRLSTIRSIMTSSRALVSSARFTLMDAARDPDRFCESLPTNGALPPPRQGPISPAKRSFSKGTSRGDVLRKETSQLTHISEGVRRRMSSVLKYAGIDIDTDTDKLKQLWLTFDSDGDGTIDYQEFCKYTCDLLDVHRADNGESATLTVIEKRLIQLVTLESKRFANCMRSGCHTLTKGAHDRRSLRAGQSCELRESGREDLPQARPQPKWPAVADRVHGRHPRTRALDVQF